METEKESCTATSKEIKDNGIEEGPQVISGDSGEPQDISHLVAKDDRAGTEDDDLLMDAANDKKEKTDTPDVSEKIVILASTPDNKASKESSVKNNSSSKTENASNLHAVTSKNQDDQNSVTSSTILTNAEQSKTSIPKASVPRQSKPSSVTVVPTSKKDASQSNEQGDEPIVVQLTQSLQNEIDSDLLDLPKNADKKATKTSQPLSSANLKDDDVKKKSCIEASSVASNRNTDKKDATKNETSKDGKSSLPSSPPKTAKKDIKIPQISRNLWVSGLSSNTKAANLKSLFSKHGKVLGAKVVTNARNPGSKCYGFVTMGTPDEATACIQHVNRTEFHGRMISVERAKTEPQGGKTTKTTPSSAKASTKPVGVSTVTKTEKKQATSTKNLTDKNVTKEKEAKHSDEKVINSGKKKPEEGAHVGRSKDKPSAPIREKKQRDSLSFAKIKAARERTRLRTKQRFLRDEERRLRFGLQQKHYHQEFIEQRQREEKMNLDREKRKLREMKEQLEREKMETERLKLETERLRIQKEQESYRREQQRVLQQSRPLKRSIDHGRREDEWSRKKRPTTSERFVPERRQVRPERKQERYERRESEQGARYDNYREERPNRRESFRHEEVERSRTQREYKGRDERRVVYREERSIESRSQREERVSVRESTRGKAKIDSRSEWKIEREPTRGSQSSAWNGPVDYKTQSGWASSSSNYSTSRQTGTWQSGGVVMSQPGASYTMQPGAVMASNMGATPIIIAQAGAMQGTPVILQGNISRHGDGHYNLSSGTVRRY